MSTRLAHVSYVLSEQEQVANSGSDFAFIASPLTDIWNLAVFGAVIAFITAIVFASHKLPAIKDRIRFFRGRARTYQEFIPLILRFSLGIALIGAGSQQTLLTPSVPNQPAFATIQMMLGFLLIIGLAVTPATLCALALAAGALFLHPELINNLEIIAALIALLLLGQPKPGADDLIGISMYNFKDTCKRYVPLILRLGLGIALLVMAIHEKFMNPHLFGTVVEQYGLTTYLPLSTGMWVVSATLTELVLGLALVLGLQTRVISVITFSVLGLLFFIFGEEVYAHVTIFGTLAVLIITGGGALSLDNLYAKRRQHQT